MFGNKPIDRKSKTRPVVKCTGGNLMSSKDFSDSPQTLVSPGKNPDTCIVKNNGTFIRC